MDLEFAKWLATLGVGGVLAGVMFGFYRKDMREFTGLWRNQSDMLMTVVKENTTALVALSTQFKVTEALHRRLDAMDGEFPHRKHAREDMR